MAFSRKNTRGFVLATGAVAKVATRAAAKTATPRKRVTKPILDPALREGRIRIFSGD